MPEIKLKPCPFCGSKAELLIVPGRMTKWVVRCTKCYANNGTFVSDHDAVEAWNMRAEPIRCGECKHMMPDGRCDEFADETIRPSASDFYSYAEWARRRAHE